MRFTIYECVGCSVLFIESVWRQHRSPVPGMCRACTHQLVSDASCDDIARCYSEILSEHEARRMFPRIRAAVLMVAILVLVCWPVMVKGVQCTYRHDGSVLLPDTSPNCTPGVVIKGENVTSKSFRTDQVRDVTKEEKSEVCRMYGVPTDKCNGKVGEFDHSISLGLQGSNAIGNIWFEPYAGVGARVKDKLEDRLILEVRARKESLTDAQNCIRSDWAQCYRRIFHQAP